MRTSTRSTLARSSAWLVGLLAAVGCAGRVPEAPRASPTPSPAALARRPSTGSTLLDDVRQVSAGITHTCALRRNGSVWCWGDNHVGQLGDGSRESSRTPVRVRALPPARAIAAGARSSCAVTIEGEVYCWSANSVGQLGDGRSGSGHPSPVKVTAVEEARAIFGSHVAERYCAIAGDRSRLLCWGRLSTLGGDGRPVIASSAATVEPGVEPVVSVAIGGGHECVLTEEGQVLCRGFGAFGELGVASSDLAARFLPVSRLDTVTSIAAGERHSCAIRDDGSVWCWGDNSRGQLGTGGLSSFTVPRRIALPTPVRRVVAGHAHSCALSEHGTIYCWGNNARGQLAGSGKRPSLEPRAVRLYARAHDLTAGALHTCALLASGGVQCWGDNVGGQLGDGTTSERVWPVAVLRGPQLGAVVPG